MAKDLKIKTIFEAVDKTSKVLGKMQSKVAKFTDGASRKFRKLDRMLSGIAGGIGKGIKTGLKYATVGAVAIGGALYKVMDAYSKFENAEAAFTPLMKGAEGARAMVERLKQEAATTPFQFENLANTAQQLLPVMNGNIDETIKKMRMMGDVSGGNTQKMESITRGYMKAMLKGKVDMESLNMIAEAGVPIFDQLAQSMGKKTGTQFYKSISAGRVKVDDLNKAFEKMTSEGGLFYKGMDIASQTLSGRISTLKDNVTNAAAELGGVLAPTMKMIVDEAIKLVPVITDWIKANKGLIQTKISKFIKEIPGYLSEIYTTGKEIGGTFKTIASAMAPVLDLVVRFIKYVGPGNIAKLTAGFFAVTVAVKGVSKSLDLLNSAANLNFKGIAKGGALLAAAVIGWKIGDKIRSELIDPLIEAEDRLKKLTGEVADTMGRDASKRNTDQLKKDIKKVSEAQKAFEGATTTKVADFIPGMSFFTDTSRRGLAQEKKRLQSALDIRRTQENVARYGGGDINTSESNPWEMDSPSVTTNESSSETRIISEVTIKDESGKARVTRGKNGRGFTLVQTGGM